MRTQDMILANVGIGMIILLGVVRLLSKNGIFCYTPCGAHVCILDTNRGTQHLQETLKKVAEDYHSREMEKTKPNSRDQLHCAQIVKEKLDNNILDVKTFYKCKKPGTPCEMESGISRCPEATEATEEKNDNENPTCTIS